MPLWGLAILSLGILINIFYHVYTYVSTGYLLGDIKRDPLGYAIVFLTIPLFVVIGYLYERNRGHRRELEELDRLKTLFLDLLRYDLPASLKSIKEGVKWLEGENGSNKERKRVLDLMKEEVNGLEKTIEDIATLADLHIGPGDFTYADIGNYIEDVLKEMRVAAEEKGIEVICELERTYTAWCSPAIRNVFAQIVSNAIKYSPENSRVVIEIVDVGDEWEIATGDAGGGVPDRNKESIFRRLEGIKEGIKGTGLGLAIVKKVVELHSGRVWVEDNKAGGSIFYVRLPKWRE
jgi:hypothetical protein